jgi:hypothetical protein
MKIKIGSSLKEKETVGDLSVGDKMIVKEICGITCSSPTVFNNMELGFKQTCKRSLCGSVYAI